MIAGLYIAGDSVLHRARPGHKLAALALGATLAMLLPGLAAACGVLVCVLLLYALAGLPLRVLGLQLRPLLPVLVLIGVTQALMGDAAAVPAVLVRLTALILGAGLVTLTTRSLDMVAALERGLQPLRFMLRPDRVALAVSLAIRFIPVLAAILAEVREAQKARGREGHFLALAVPVTIRVLKMTDEVAEAIDARG